MQAENSSNMPDHSDPSFSTDSRFSIAEIARVLSAVILLVGCGAAGLFLFSLYNRYFLAAELASSFRVQLLAISLVCGLALLVVGRRRRGLLLVLLAVPFLVSLSQVFSTSEQPPAGERILTVMAMNVLTDNWQYGEVIDHVREVDPDVLLLVEYSHGWHEGVEKLNRDFPHRWLQPRWHGYGMGIFSKHPLENTEYWELTRDVTPIPALAADVTFGGQRLRIAGLHTMSPTGSKRLTLRNRQMVEITERLSDRDAPTMLMGDFNCTPWAAVFQDVLEQSGYRDSRIGQGYLASWNMNLPWPMWIPIDHALVSDEIHVHERIVGRPCGSDHLPTIIRVSLTPAAE